MQGEAFGRRPRCKPHRPDRPSSETLHNSGLMRCNKNGAVSENRLSGVQLIEQCFGLLQIERVEAFAEPSVDRRKKLAGLLPFALIAP
jgi:hypothetical protein